MVGCAWGFEVWMGIERKISGMAMGKSGVENQVYLRTSSMVVYAEVDIAQAVLAQGVHAEFDGFLLDDHGGGAVGDQFADGIGDVEQLVEAAAAAVAGLAAGVAAGTGEELFVAEFVGGDAELAEDGLVGLVGGFAVLADGADEALGEHAFERGGDEERLAAHVDETGDGAGGVVGVEGGEHQVAGERGLDGDGGGFLVAHFPDHDAVRVLAEEGAQDAGKSRPMASLMGIWMMPSMSYSTGSSAVRSLESMVLMRRRAA
jgi:hypothetical protein